MAPDLGDLMARYCDGDEAAFRALYAALAPRLLHYARSLVGDRAAAEDVLQRTFLKLHLARHTYVRGADPAPWLFTIVRRLCLDEYRERARNRSALEADSHHDEHAGVSGSVEGAAEKALAAERREAATLAALESLPPHHRQSLVLTKLHGHSTARAAAIAGTTQGALKVRAHRAYRFLRRLLAEEDVE
jgi:RNA polymerase sigma-70 factor (ECF subfamily)